MWSVIVSWKRVSEGTFEEGLVVRSVWWEEKGKGREAPSYARGEGDSVPAIGFLSPLTFACHLFCKKIICSDLQTGLTVALSAQGHFYV